MMRDSGLGGTRAAYQVWCIGIRPSARDQQNTGPRALDFAIAQNY